MSQGGGASGAPKKGLTLDDLIAAIDRHERNPSNIPKVDTFHFCGERDSEWLERVEQALVARSDVVKFQRILQYVLHSYHQEVKKVIDAAQGSWERFKEGMQRKYRLGDGLLTTADLEAMNKEDLTTIGAFVQEFKKRARKVHGISEKAQCAIFLGLLTASEAVELTRHGGGSTKLNWATIDRGVDVGCLDQVEQRQVRLQRQKRKERDVTASGTLGVTRIVTDVLAQLGYATEPVVQRRVVTAVQVKGTEPVIEEVVQEELWEEEESVPQRLTKAQRKVRNLAQGGQGSGKAQAPQAVAAAPPSVAAPSSTPGRPGVNVVGSCPQSGMMGRPLTPQARQAQAARTRSQANASANQEPPRREPEPGKWKEAMKVEDDDDEEEEDERLRREEDQRAEQRARKKGTRGEAKSVIRDGPPKRKKYAVRLEEGFDVEKVIDQLLEGHNDLMTLKEILASAPRLRDELKGRLSRRLVPNVHLGTILPKEAEWAESGTKMDSKCVACGTVDLVVKGSKCTTMVDTGAEMNIIREADAIKFGLDINHSDCGILHGASCKAVFCGTASNVLIEVGKVKARACFFIMPDVDHGILLGRSFLSRTKTLMFNKNDRTLILLLCDPACGNYDIITCRNTGPRSIRNRPNPGSFTIEESEGERRRLRAEPKGEEEVKAFSLSLSDVGKAMDLVAAHEMADPDAIQALREQVLECPETGRLEMVYQDEEAYYERERGLIRRMRESALAGPCRINEGNEGELIIGEPNFLLPQEQTLMVELMKRRHNAYAFSDEERGMLDVDKIRMIRIHTVLHEPWNMQGARYPNPDEEKKVVDYLDGKIRTHVADYSSGPYASPWFCFIKPNGTLRWVQDLQRLNAVTVWDAGGLPNAKAERALSKQVRDMARDWESCRAHLREAFRRPEPPQPIVERHLRSQRQRDPEPREARPSRGGRKALARREAEPEPEPEAEERGPYPECGLGAVEFHRFTAGGLRRSPARVQEEPPASEGPLRELEAHLDISRWRTSPRDEEREGPVEEAPAEEVPREEVPREEVPREEVPREEAPHEEIPREEVRDTQQERGLGHGGRRAGKEVIEVGEDTPPQTPAVGLRLGDAPGSMRQSGEKELQREEAPLPSSRKAPSPESKAEKRRKRAAVRREALTLIDRHLAAHALEHPDLEEPTLAEPRQEPCQPEKEMEAEIPKRVDLRTRERAPAGETGEEKRARRTRRIEEIWQERQRLEAAGELPEQQQERQRLEAAGALPGQPPSEPAKAPEIPEMWRDF
ncbi:hypothetical protein CBR_g32670 [Chara braunii]|uniref:Peptidase A2 domain-containing protein n=1 Tax=Chara braunii TaxID=69332 RepID=A0A388LHE9_CHABU|nr:hypothetical protein CBR_g32670 [Chara braunii]|eukprot:GBG81675.1 hypothetical protein CBR_g32670 [Chara braunii]